MHASEAAEKLLGKGSQHVVTLRDNKKSGLGSTNAGLADVLDCHSSDKVGTADFRGDDRKRRKIGREKGRVLQKLSR